MSGLVANRHECGTYGAVERDFCNPDSRRAEVKCLMVVVEVSGKLSKKNLSRELFRCWLTIFSIICWPIIKIYFNFNDFESHGRFYYSLCNISWKKLFNVHQKRFHHPNAIRPYSFILVSRCYICFDSRFVLRLQFVRNHRRVNRPRVKWSRNVKVEKEKLKKFFSLNENIGLCVSLAILAFYNHQFF